MSDPTSGWDKVVNSILAAALAFFAWIQWRLMKRNEEQRRTERKFDQHASRIAAFSAVDAEWFRIWAVSKRWGASDLVQAARDGVFDPNEIAPRDWGAVTEQLGRLGLEASKFASYAFVHAADAAVTATQFITLVRSLPQRVMDQRSAYQPVVSRTQLEVATLERIDGMEKEIKNRARDAADLLEDALRQTRWGEERRLEFDKDGTPTLFIDNDKVQSAVGRRLMDAFRERQTKTSEPNSSASQTALTDGPLGVSGVEHQPQ